MPCVCGRPGNRFPSLGLFRTGNLLGLPPRMIASHQNWLQNLLGFLLVARIFVDVVVGSEEVFEFLM